MTNADVLADAAPPLPAGFAARPDLTGITGTVSCNATPGCTPATPCADCRLIMEGGQ